MANCSHSSDCCIVTSDADDLAQAGQFYSASWWIDRAQNGMWSPPPAEIRPMLSDICTNSDADVSFENMTFSINGSDDAVKEAMMVIYQIPFVKRSSCQIRVKIELANEHKEFVSGKKNGKINKIMGQSELYCASILELANSFFLSFLSFFNIRKKRKLAI
jgi:hypothetical protein